MAAGDYAAARDTLVHIQGLMATLPAAERRNAKLAWTPSNITDAIRAVERLIERAAVAAVLSPLMSQNITYTRPTA
jgi:hypothetical protein